MERWLQWAHLPKVPCTQHSSALKYDSQDFCAHGVKIAERGKCIAFLPVTSICEPVCILSPQGQIVYSPG